MIENDKLKHSVYIAKRQDSTDEQLCLYLNDFPEREKLKVSFIRETDGIYNFGTKRVFLKLERGDQIMVRVGGGYMHIDDFLEQYTPLEVEKIRRKDVISNFQNRATVQEAETPATAGFSKKGSLGKQRSPKRPPASGPRSPQRSPKQLTKKI